jgi:hypothetical protein
MTGSRAKDSLRLAAACTFALLIALGGGAAFAHHRDNGHKDSGNNDKASQHASSHGGDWGGDRGWDHHHHNRHKKPAGLGPVHGPGSSHNPIVYHPVHGPGLSHNPVIVPVIVVRDHRTPPPRPPRTNYRDSMCRRGHLSYCSPDHVRDHRTPPGTQCLGDLC